MKIKDINFFYISKKKSSLLTQPVPGYNGNDELKLGMSSSMGLNIYDSAKQKLRVENQQKNIEFWIPREKNLNLNPYQFVNISSINSSVLDDSPYFLNFNFNVNLSNYSIHVQIKPINKTTAYLVLIKLGITPKLDENSKVYDLFKIVCNKNKSEYMIFLNMNSTNGFRGKVGVSIRELDSNETSYFCDQNQNQNASLPYSPPLAQNKISNLTNDFWIRIFLSGCYYYDSIRNIWAADGVEVAEDTNIEYTHCVSEHLTEFAGGFLVLPTEINFDYVWANASFLRNPIIYSTVIVLCVLYVLLAVACRYFDIQDKKKIGLTCIKSQYATKDDFNYEISLFTGTRRNAGTSANVFVSIYGLDEKTEGIKLYDNKRKCFTRSGIDSFIISSRKYCSHIRNQNLFNLI